MLTVCLALTGCTHLHEDRAITAFTDALNGGDVKDLRAVTSSDFGQKALRRAEAMDDLEILGLPDEMPSIVEVEDVSKTEKQVTVTTGEGETELLYKLTKTHKGNWVVDDIFTRQEKSGVTVAKPITEQMDLLLTIRDFLEAWESDDRTEVLAVTTPEFRGTLSSLPAPWLARITQQVVGNSERLKSRRNHKPQVSIDGDKAVVQLPRTDGTLRLLLTTDQVGWKVDDVSIRTRREETLVGSIRNNARVIAAGTQFAEAFASGDKDKLQTLATSNFYNDVLRTADLAVAKMPDIALAPSEFELKATVDHASLLIPTASQAVRIEFKRFEDLADATAAEYRVKEVSLYDSKGENQIRLSSLFTAEKRVREFHTALSSGRLEALKTLSSSDLKQDVWSRATGLPLQLLPIGATSGRILRRTDTKFRGSMTHVTMQHTHGNATYSLTDAGNQLVIDDITVQRGGKSVSLKRDLKLAIPILKFAGAFQTNQVDDLQRVCSRDFGRRVWDRTKVVPPAKVPVMANLTRPISGLRTQPGRARVELGTARSGAIVDLVKENQFWVIDDVEIFTGVEPSKHVQLKSSMAEFIADARQQGKKPEELVAKSTPRTSSGRKRFDLRRKDETAMPPRTLARIDGPPVSPIAATPAPTHQPKRLDLDGPLHRSERLNSADWEPLPGAKFAEVEAQPIQQVAGTKTDGGVQHAMMFAPLDEKPQAQLATPATTTAPAILNAPESVTPMPQPKKATGQSEQVDLDALFADFPEQAQLNENRHANAVPAASASPRPKEASKVVPIVSSLPPHDAGRVTDPALQPIRIPRE